MRAKPSVTLLCLLGLAATGACGEARRTGAPAGAAPAVIGKAEASPEQPAALPPLPALPLKIAPDLTVRAVRFGILKADETADDQFVATEEVPPFDGQAFGWVVEVDTTRHTLHWQEHLRMPAPPADWGDAASDPDVIISKDGMSVIAQGEDEVDEAELSRFYWSLATGDPAGDYELDLAVEGRRVAHIRFHVAAPVKEQTLLVLRPAPRHGFVPVVLRTAPAVTAFGAGRGAGTWN